MDTTWYVPSDTTFTTDNMTFSNVTPVADGVTIAEESSTIAMALLNMTAANTSDANSTQMPDCDTNKPILIIITQVKKHTQFYQHVLEKISLLDI
jgi:hypothetical protein